MLKLEGVRLYRGYGEAVLTKDKDSGRLTVVVTADDDDYTTEIDLLDLLEWIAHHGVVPEVKLVTENEINRIMELVDVAAEKNKE